MNVATAGFFTNTPLAAEGGSVPATLPGLPATAGQAGQQTLLPPAGFALALSSALSGNVAGQPAFPAAAAAAPAAFGDARNMISLDTTLLAGSAPAATAVASASSGLTAASIANELVPSLGTVALAADAAVARPVAQPSAEGVAELADVSPDLVPPAPAAGRPADAFEPQTPPEVKVQASPPKALSGSPEPALAAGTEPAQPSSGDRSARQPAPVPPSPAALSQAASSAVDETGQLQGVASQLAALQADPAASPLVPKRASSKTATAKESGDSPADAVDRPQEIKTTSAMLGLAIPVETTQVSAEGLPSLSGGTTSSGEPTQAVGGSAAKLQHSEIGAATSTDASPADPDMNAAGDGAAPAFTPVSSARNSAAAREASFEPASRPHLAEPMVNARPGQIGREMGVEIARRAQAGGDELLVRLNPQDLGRIEVRMSFDDSGSLRAVVTADSAVALDMLRRDAGDLGRALSDAGVRADGQSLKFDARGDTGGFAGHRSPSGGGQGQARQGFVQDENFESDNPAYRPIRSAGQVDLIA